MTSLNDAVRSYWENAPCGTGEGIVGKREAASIEWFNRICRHRYSAEPHILRVVDFEQGRGKRLLEIGVGAGVDHLQWARAGAQCHGVDLTDAAISLTRAHLAAHGLSSVLRRADAEHLPFEDGFFDVVYSWGVIHHSEHPETIVAEIHRVLKPGGTFLGMMYNRHSAVAFKLWVRRALIAGRWTRTLGEVLSMYMESPGTKAYTAAELRSLFGRFAEVRLEPIVTVYDRKWLPPVFANMLPASWGWNFAITARAAGPTIGAAEESAFSIGATASG